MRLTLITSLLAVSSVFAIAQQRRAPLILDCGGKSSTFQSNTSAADLAKKFGKNNLKNEDIPLGEGETEPGTVLFPNDPAKRIEITWKDKAKQRSPALLQVTSPQSPPISKTEWKTREGITLGTSLKEIERLNQRPFTLTGFGWDYSGTVISWRNGKLQPSGRQYCRVLVRLIPDEEKHHDLEQQVLGDSDFSSGHPAMQALNPRVYQMIVDFNYRSIPAHKGKRKKRSK